MELDRIPLWRGNHVAVKQLTEGFARYLYLPRLKDSAVLIGAIRDGVALLTWQKESFAFADSFDDGASRYRGLRAGRGISLADTDSHGFLVQGDVARAQLDNESVPPPAPVANYGKAPDGAGATPTRPGEAVPLGAPKPVAALPKRFHGTVRLDTARVGRDAGRVAEEVIAHLAKSPERPRTRGSHPFPAPRTPAVTRLPRPVFPASRPSACPPRRRRPPDQRAPCPPASHRREPPRSGCPASFATPPAGRCNLRAPQSLPGAASATVPARRGPPRTPRDRLRRPAPLPRTPRDKLPGSAPSPRTPRDRPPGRGSAPRMGQDRLPPARRRPEWVGTRRTASSRRPEGPRAACPNLLGHCLEPRPPWAVSWPTK